jgi:hypothetical protein
MEELRFFLQPNIGTTSQGRSRNVGDEVAERVLVGGWLLVAAVVALMVAARPREQPNWVDLEIRSVQPAVVTRGGVVFGTTPLVLHVPASQADRWRRELRLVISAP